MQKWEYLVVRIQGDGSGVLFPMEINFVEQRNWKKGPNLAVYMNQLGEQGWEFVSAVWQSNQLIFKRPKP